ncbi:MAG: hypothetical protein JW794_09460 [Candidatus Cloacimonetes bacterium]|nr:hypothetical protein [Candidatus Cloacimonadota bacterium]
MKNKFCKSHEIYLGDGKDLKPNLVLIQDWGLKSDCLLSYYFPRLKSRGKSYKSLFQNRILKIVENQLSDNGDNIMNSPEIQPWDIKLIKNRDFNP